MIDISRCIFTNRKDVRCILYGTKLKPASKMEFPTGTISLVQLTINEWNKIQNRKKILFHTPRRGIHMCRKMENIKLASVSPREA